MLPFLIAALAIVAVAAVLVAWHVRSWRRAKAPGRTAGELKFAFEQYRRRMQTSVMLGLVGVLILAGPWITAPLAVLLYWLGVIVLIVWIVLLAGADMLATRMHYAQAEAEQHLKQVKLHAALEAEQRKRDEGKSAKWARDGGR
jgi:flagellar basal body-associated protein FliL